MKKPSLLFLNPPCYKPVLRDCYTTIFPMPGLFYWHPLDLLLQAGIFRRHGNTHFIDAPLQGLNEQEVINRACEVKPELTVSLISRNTLDSDLVFLKFLSKKTGSKIAVSGDEAFLNSESLTDNFPFIHACLKDMASEELLPLIGIEQTDESACLTHANPVSTERNIPSGHHTLLASLPYRLPNFQGNFLSILTSTGCQHRCHFCDVPVYIQKPWHRNNDQVIDEIEHAAKKTGIQQVFFRDPLLNSNKKRFADLLYKIIRKNLNLSWTAWIRPADIDRDLAELMKASGAAMIHCGAETASDKLLHTLNKGCTVQEISKGIENLAYSGINVAGHFMTGIPGGNTMIDKETFRWARKLPLAASSFNHFSFRPGTPVNSSKTVYSNLKTNSKISDNLHSQTKKIPFSTRLKLYHIHPERIQTLTKLLVTTKSRKSLLSLISPLLATVCRVLYISLNKAKGTIS